MLDLRQFQTLSGLRMFEGIEVLPEAMSEKEAVAAYHSKAGAALEKQVDAHEASQAAHSGEGSHQLAHGKILDAIQAHSDAIPLAHGAGKGRMMVHHKSAIEDMRTALKQHYAKMAPMGLRKTA